MALSVAFSAQIIFWNPAVCAAATMRALAAANGRVERYDGATDSWSVLAPLPTPVADLAATADGLGHILAIGGFDLNGVRTANVARFDIATGIWSDTAVPDMPAELCERCLFEAPTTGRAGAGRLCTRWSSWRTRPCAASPTGR